MQLVGRGALTPFFLYLDLPPTYTDDDWWWNICNQPSWEKLFNLCSFTCWTPLIWCNYLRTYCDEEIISSWTRVNNQTKRAAYQVVSLVGNFAMSHRRGWVYHCVKNMTDKHFRDDDCRVCLNYAKRHLRHTHTHLKWFIKGEFILPKHPVETGYKPHWLIAGNVRLINFSQSLAHLSEHFHGIAIFFIFAFTWIDQKDIQRFKKKIFRLVSL